MSEKEFVKMGEEEKFFKNRRVEVQNWERQKVEGRMSFEELIERDKVR